MFTGSLFSEENKTNVLLIGLTPTNLERINADDPAFLRPNTHATPPGWSIILATVGTFKKWIASGEIGVPSNFVIPEAPDRPIIGTAGFLGGRALIFGLTKTMMAKLSEGGAIEIDGWDDRMPVGWEFFIFTGESEVAIAQKLEKNGYINGKTISKFDPRLFKN